jgi:hypothetical protein
VLLRNFIVPNSYESSEKDYPESDNFGNRNEKSFSEKLENVIECKIWIEECIKKKKMKLMMVINYLKRRNGRE